MERLLFIILIVINSSIACASKPAPKASATPQALSAPASLIASPKSVCEFERKLQLSRRLISPGCRQRLDDFLKNAAEVKSSKIKMAAAIDKEKQHKEVLLLIHNPIIDVPGKTLHKALFAKTTALQKAAFAEHLQSYAQKYPIVRSKFALHHEQSLLTYQRLSATTSFDKALDLFEKSANALLESADDQTKSLFTQAINDSKGLKDLLRDCTTL